MQDALLQEKKIQEARLKVEEAKLKMLSYYDVDRFDSNFLSDSITLFN